MVYTLLLAALATLIFKNSFVDSYINKVTKRQSVASRIEEFGPKIDAQLQPAFAAASVSYPPPAAALLYIKDEQVLHLYAGEGSDHLKLIKSYHVKAASGHQGPKLQEGDNQVPEGLYQIESLNPNSLFHLALKVNYPNSNDKDYAQADNRHNLGGDIMIHGSSASVGCIAIGDEAIEEVFILAAKSNYANWQLILSPTDFRKHNLNIKDSGWIPELYKKISERVKKLPISEVEKAIELKPSDDSKSAEYCPDQTCDGLDYSGNENATLDLLHLYLFSQSDFIYLKDWKASHQTRLLVESILNRPVAKGCDDGSIQARATCVLKKQVSLKKLELYSLGYDEGAVSRSEVKLKE